MIGRQNRAFTFQYFKVKLVEPTNDEFTELFQSAFLVRIWIIGINDHSISLESCFGLPCCVSQIRESLEDENKIHGNRSI